MKDRLLFLEGSSLTSRETLTVLLTEKYKVDVLSPDRFSIAAFSRLTHMLTTVDVNTSPLTYLKQVGELLQKKNYVAILPTHEEGWLLANGKNFLSSDLPIALSEAEVFKEVAGKIAFAELADKLDLPVPEWEYVTDLESIHLPYPYWLKADYGTAGRSVYKVTSDLDLKNLVKRQLFGNERWMAQQDIKGQYGQVQAVFSHGKLLALHSNIKIGSGSGGSAAARLSINSAGTREHIEKIGQHLKWHGGLTLDFISHNHQPYYIECNPRMVEPANAYKAGVNFPKILIDLAQGKESQSGISLGKPGVKTHSLLALVIGTAERTQSRRKIWQTIREWLFKSDSAEVLTPIRKDLPSVIPLVVIAIRLLLNPKSVKKLVAHTVDHYSVDSTTIKAVEQQASIKTN
ncbi:ATP-grasp domain-containing protein [Streptococcus oralis subsp. tigurinus]|uniref:Carboxylate--amine ligase n=1 Tax=Streptococcus oralis subsp. tigurinus TaxID=1077464 RepID=A0A1X1G024_STROR|nr:ATP-grasp domain-containing protein [Streptococcus oralis]MCY7079629.1 ATP-grasp domain-containing protein [Streptococcus oralis]ORO40037.1 carboxylate--amine ligase [Streptococcus oralis subsp. tigurinus]